MTDYILRHEDYFRKVMEEQLRVESTEKLTVLKKQLARNEKRIADLKRLFMKIYEDNASGKLSDERFDMMSQSYDAEQKQLEEEVLSIQQEIEVQEQQIENIEKFVQKAHKYVHIEELTPYALRELVSAIYVDAPDKSSGKRVQHIHIKYDGLGYIPLDELEAKKGVTEVTPNLPHCGNFCKYCFMGTLRWGTPCCTYRYRLWLLAGCVRVDAPCFVSSWLGVRQNASPQLLIGFFRHRLAPLVRGAFAGYFHCQMREPAIGCSTVPVLDLRGMFNTLPGCSSCGALPHS